MWRSIVLIIFACASFAEATEYAVPPGSTMSLGRGVHRIDVDQIKRVCVDYSDVAQVDQSSSNSIIRSARVTIDSAKSLTELYSKLNIDVSMRAKYGLFKANASYSLEKELGVENSDLMWMMRAQVEYSRREIRNPTVKQEFSQKSDPDFESQCGTEFVVQERRGESIYVLFVGKTNNRDFRERMDASFNASARFGAGSFSAAASLKQLYTMASQVGNMNVFVIANGGNSDQSSSNSSMTILAKLATLNAAGSENENEIQLSTLQDLVQDYIAKFDEKNGVPIGYITAPYSAAGKVTKPDLVAPDQDRVTTELWDLYLTNAQRRADLVSIQRDDEAAQQLGETYPALVEQIKTLDQRLSVLVGFAGACLESNRLPPPPLELSVCEGGPCKIPERGQCQVPVFGRLTPLDLPSPDRGVRVSVQLRQDGVLLMVRGPRILRVRIALPGHYVDSNSNVLTGENTPVIIAEYPRFYDYAKSVTLSETQTGSGPQNSTASASIDKAINQNPPQIRSSSTTVGSNTSGSQNLVTASSNPVPTSVINDEIRTITFGFNTFLSDINGLDPSKVYDPPLPADAPARFLYILKYGTIIIDQNPPGFYRDVVYFDPVTSQLPFSSKYVTVEYHPRSF